MNNTEPVIVFFDAEESDCLQVQEQFPHARFAKAHLTPQEIVETCKDATVISCFINTAFPRSIIEQLPHLRLLCTRSVGCDHIDLAACAERGITVCNVPDYGSHVIAEHVFALLLSSLRHISEGDKRVEDGVFDYHGLRGMALKGKTMGIVGTGKIGRKVAKIAYGYEMEILAYDACTTKELEEELHVHYVSLEAVLHQSDIITLHLPATQQTHHMLNAQAFADMKDGVILVNTARGSLIDSKALYDALETGKVSLALLDVLENEENFEQNKNLIHHPHVVVTPHIAFYADDSMRNMYTDTLMSIQQWIDGKTPDHIVHPLTIVCDVPK